VAGSTKSQGSAEEPWWRGRRPSLSLLVDELPGYLLVLALAPFTGPVFLFHSSGLTWPLAVPAGLAAGSVFYAIVIGVIVTVRRRRAGDLASRR
jgi:hypothetical protein